ncbi:hypothetical protein B0T20DRAFT_389371 [Sordaria brevicollis]|uniref:Uncharacterized protein n=1 Tax=Sordaria brevicollis TaxID=83679 RepID=A0AAE0PKD6_SORBR|nr:hypothetical protein B0T20DRAFT_389371 [Sordaria brevicollis]
MSMVKEEELVVKSFAICGIGDCEVEGLSTLHGEGTCGLGNIPPSYMLRVGQTHRRLAMVFCAPSYLSGIGFLALPFVVRKVQTWICATAFFRSERMWLALRKAASNIASRTSWWWIILVAGFMPRPGP